MARPSPDGAWAAGPQWPLVRLAVGAGGDRRGARGRPKRTTGRSRRWSGVAPSNAKDDDPGLKLGSEACALAGPRGGDREAPGRTPAPSRNRSHEDAPRPPRSHRPTIAEASSRTLRPLELVEACVRAAVDRRRADDADPNDRFRGLPSRTPRSMASPGPSPGARGRRRGDDRHARGHGTRRGLPSAPARISGCGGSRAARLTRDAELLLIALAPDSIRGSSGSRPPRRRLTAAGERRAGARAVQLRRESRRWAGAGPPGAARCARRRRVDRRRGPGPAVPDAGVAGPGPGRRPSPRRRHVGPGDRAPPRRRGRGRDRRRRQPRPGDRRKRAADLPPGAAGSSGHSLARAALDRLAARSSSST